MSSLDNPASQDSSWNSNADNPELLKAIIAAGLWPSLVRIAMPSAKFDQSISGTVQRDHEARAVKFFDDSGRVFLHPGSTLFTAKDFRSGYLSTFAKSAMGNQDKTYLRDANEAPMLGLFLLSAGRVAFDHKTGGLEIRSAADEKKNIVRVRADARIGVLCNQLRRLVDAVLDDSLEDPGRLQTGHSREILQTVASALASK